MRKLAFKAGRRGRKVEAMDEPNDRRASRGMSVVRPIAFAVLRFRIVSYRVGSTIYSRDRGPCEMVHGQFAWHKSGAG